MARISQPVVAVGIAAIGIGFSTALLAKELVGSGVFLTLVALFLLVGLLIFLADRLREFSLRDLSVKLDEIKKEKAEVEALYSKIDHLQRATMEMDGKVMGKLGVSGGGLAMTSAVIRYCTGCIKRERERLARIFAEQKSPETIAQAILDNQLDELVFKWNGPEVSLDTPPVSVEERAAREAAKKVAEAPAEKSA